MIVGRVDSLTINHQLSALSTINYQLSALPAINSSHHQLNCRRLGFAINQSNDITHHSWPLQPAQAGPGAAGIFRFSVRRFLAALVLLLFATPFFEDMKNGHLVETALATLVLCMGFWPSAAAAGPLFWRSSWPCLRSLAIGCTFLSHDLAPGCGLCGPVGISRFCCGAPAGFHPPRTAGQFRGALRGHLDIPLAGRDLGHRLHAGG